MQRGVIYARYSPGPNQREESIEGQIRECTEYAKKNDIQILGTYIDRAISGRTDVRADFQRMLRDVEKKMFDAIIVWKTDRFGRNREEIAVNKLKCKKNGAQVLSATENIPKGSTGVILEALLEGLAEYYSVELSEKITRGLTENALKGKATHGNVGLGYRVGEDKRIEIDEVNAPTIRRIFEMFAEGFKYSEIITKLNELGLKTKTGGSFNKNSLHRMLNNERYIGVYQWRDIIIKDGIPPIISKELYERCQEKMRKVNRAPGGGKAKVNYLLTGKIFCGLCENNMNGDSGTGRHGGKFHYYKCSGRKNKKNGCTKETAKKDWIEHLVADTIYNEVLMNDDIIEDIADSVIRIQKKARDGSILASLEIQYTDVEKSIKNILRLVEQGNITSSTNERLTELEYAKEDIAGRIAAERLAQIEITRDHIVYWLTQFREMDTGKPEDQRKIIDTFVHTVFLYDDKIIITGNYIDRQGNREKITLDDLKQSDEEGITGLVDSGKSLIMGIIEGSDKLSQSP